MERKARLLVDGVLAGLLGAFAVAVWFLSLDAARGHPFRTPVILASALMHGSAPPADSGLFALRVLEYSVVHFAAFAVFGLVVAWLIVAASRRPSYLLGLIGLLAVFEVLYVVVIEIFQPELKAWISGRSALVANLIATAVMTGYFFLRNPDIGGSLFGPKLSVVTEGILSGLIGGAIVALWFLLLDLGVGSPLKTPAALGSAFLGTGANTGGMLTVTPLILGYTMLHFAVFIGFGLLLAFLLAATENEPMYRLGLVLLFGLTEVFFLLSLILVDDSLLKQLSSVRIALGNLLASLGMVGFFFLRHRRLQVWHYLLARRSIH